MMLLSLIIKLTSRSRAACFRKAATAIAAMTLAWAHAETPQCRVLLDSGDIYYRQFENGRALDWFRQANIACKGDYESLMKMTRACIDAGSSSDSNNAMDMYLQGYGYCDTLQHYYPDSAQSYFLKALAAANITRLKRGMQKVKLLKTIKDNIENSIRRDPSFAPAWVLLGGYYREVASAGLILRAFARMFLNGMPEGTLEDAEHALRKALALSPGNIYAHLELARTMIAMDNKEQAVLILNEMLGLPRTWYGDNKLKEQGRRLLKKLRRLD